MPCIELQDFFCFPTHFPRHIFSDGKACHQTQPNTTIDQHHNNERTSKAAQQIVNFFHGSAEENGLRIVIKVADDRYTHDGGRNHHKNE